MRRRTRNTFAILLIALAALAVAVYLRKQAPPEAARLLPEADAIVYFNLKPLRALTHVDQHPVPHSADYQAFLDATGIQFERDLDEAAFAIHRMADANGPNGPVAYSEVFVGHFDGRRLTRYLATQSADTENYAGHTIYRIPVEGRNVRVTILGYDIVAVSNAPTPEQIHSIIDRHRAAALPFSGSTLLAQHYPDVPLLAQVWGIGKIGLPFSAGHSLRLFGIPLPLPVDTTFVASVRYLGSLRLRVEEIAPDEGAAHTSKQVANVAIQILRAIPDSGSGSTPGNNASQNSMEAEMATLLNTATVQQRGNKVILRATIPVGLLEDLFAANKDAAASAAGDASPSDASPSGKP